MSDEQTEAAKRAVRALPDQAVRELGEVLMDFGELVCRIAQHLNEATTTIPRRRHPSG